MLGHSVFTTDEKEWEASRSLLRPSFNRSLIIGDLEVFEKHSPPTWGLGQTAKSPIFLKRGTQANYHVCTMDRRKDLYGEDADEFKPGTRATMRRG